MFLLPAPLIFLYITFHFYLLYGNDSIGCLWWWVKIFASCSSLKVLEDIKVLKDLNLGVVNVKCKLESILRQKLSFSILIL